MLQSLSIKNYALIADIDIRFGEGLSILTGETGAGKSIILGALATILGERVDTTLLRQGASKAVIEGTFNIKDVPGLQQFLSQNDLATEDDLLFLRREIHDNSRSRAFINDTPVQLTTMQEVGDWLVDLHGQHEHQSLLKVKNHLAYLDQFGGHQTELQNVADCHRELQKAERQLQALQQKQQSAQEKRDFYSFQIAEINKVDPNPEEEEELLREEKISQNSERLFRLTEELYHLLYEAEGSIFEQFSKAQDRLEELASIDATFSASKDECESARLVVEELSKLVQDYRENIEFDPRRVEEIQNRIAVLSGLKKKYNRSLQEILAYRDRIQSELQTLENLDGEIASLEEEVQQRRADFSRACAALSERRKSAAAQLEQRVPDMLAVLGMPGSRFNVALEYQNDPSGAAELQGQRYRAAANGMDFARFNISTNTGEAPRPLAKVASGGEISRIMLALKSMMAKQGGIPVLVFDEIDMGVSGRIARSVGKKLRELSRFHQVICITHLPQIASMGDHHFLVEKVEKSGKTETLIRRLSTHERTEAIAKLLAGDKVSETHLSSARELLDDAVN